MLPSSALGKPFGKVWPHSSYLSRIGIHKQNVMIFAFDLTFVEPVKYIFNSFKNTHRELAIAASSVSLWPPVRTLGGGGQQNLFPPAGRVLGNNSGARVQDYEKNRSGNHLAKCFTFDQGN